MSRKKKLMLNTGMGLFKQFVTLLCGFILPRYMLMYYGSAVNGLVASITNFLGFIAFLDMGVGAVVQSNLYKPLADKNVNQISLIIKSSQKFFRKLAYIFMGYIVVLCFLFPRLKATNFDAAFTISLILIISLGTLAQYMFGITYGLLLNADQRSYVTMFFQMGTTICNTILSVILMRMGASIHAVKGVSATVYVLRPVLQMLYVKRHYIIDRSVVLTTEPIKQKWNGFAQHFAAIVCQNVDVAVLTVLSTLENISVYSVYHMVIHGVELIILTSASGLESLFGNMIAKKEKEKLDYAFSSIEWLMHTGVTVIFTVMGIVIVPFIMVYTSGVTDTDYRAPLFGALLVAAYGSKCLRVPYFVVVKAAGAYKETQNGAYISAVLNIIITVLLVFKFGLVGAALGTLVAMLYHTIYFIWFLQDNILVRKADIFFRHLLCDLLVTALSVAATNWFVHDCTSYLTWAILSAEVFVVVTLVSLGVNMVFYRKQIVALVQRKLI